MGILTTYEWSQLLSHFSTLGIAFILTLPIAWDREQSTRQMGLRTFPLVAMASCSYVLVSL